MAEQTGASHHDTLMKSALTHPTARRTSTSSTIAANRINPASRFDLNSLQAQVRIADAGSG